MAIAYFIVTSFIIALSAIIGGANIYKKEKNFSSLCFSSVMFLNGCVWFAAGLSSASWLFESEFWRNFFAYSSYFFVFLSAPFLIGYVSDRVVFLKKITRYLFIFYILASLAGIFFLFYDGLLPFKVTEWGIKSGMYSGSYFIVRVLIAVGFVFLVYSFLSGLYKRIFGGKSAEIFGIWADFSLVAYLGMGYFDAGGVIIGWPLVLIRILMVFFVLSAYFFYSQKIEKERIASLKEIEV